MKIGLIGIGLIGGSLGLDLKERGFASSVIGTSRREETANRALELGLVDNIMDKDSLIQNADLIILSVPVNILIQELEYVLDRIYKNQVVIDMGSTKEQICDKVKNHPMRSRYVATHPMAGTENSGPEAALHNLFDDKVAIIADRENSADDAITLVENLFHTLKMRVKFMDSKSHDIHAAYISHISHITSFVLASAVLEKEKSEKAILNMAGGGFESTVRLAKSSPIMWSQIFEQNDRNILEVLDVYIDKMKVFRNHIKNRNFDALEEIMKEANEIKKILK